MKCPICRKPNNRGSRSKYCSGDCKMKADKLARKRKKQESAKKQATQMGPGQEIRRKR